MSFVSLPRPILNPFIAETRQTNGHESRAPNGSVVDEKQNLPAWKNLGKIRRVVVIGASAFFGRFYLRPGTKNKAVVKCKCGDGKAFVL